MATYFSHLCSNILYSTMASRLNKLPSLGGAVRQKSNKFAFYDLVLRTPTHPSHPVEPSKVSMLNKNVYSGVYTIDNTVTAEQRIEKVFGQRIKGGPRQSSSRFLRQQPRVIAGVTVPAKPVEPDNCCMSGCINCVWEMFNDDIKDWNDKREIAAKNLVKKGGVWPADFHPPVKHLTPANLPEDYAPVKTKKPDEGWGSVPVAMKVFAEFEKKLKTRRLEREAAKKHSSSTSEKSETHLAEAD